MDDYKLFLDTHRKPNGDKLLDSTKERYIDWIKRFKGEFDDSQDLIQTMNTHTKTGNIVMYAAFMSYLKYKGFPKEKILALERPQVLPTSFSSVRMLQSQVLSRAELKILMDNTKDLKMRLILSMLYDTAARRAELMRIKFGHIEAVKEPKDNIYAKVRILGKGHKSREVYLGKVSFELLKEYSKGKKKSDYVIRFVKNGKEYKDQTHQLWKETEKHAESILGRNFHCHMMRHSKSQHMADAGADAFGLKSYLGHSKLATVEIYVQNSTFQGQRTFKNYAKDII